MIRSFVWDLLVPYTSGLMMVLTAVVTDAVFCIPVRKWRPGHIVSSVPYNFSDLPNF